MARKVRFRNRLQGVKASVVGGEPLNFGIGVHVGDVMRGNIGSRARLDFTVI
jgi:adenylate cyclase